MDRVVHVVGLPTASASCRPSASVVRAVRIDNTARDSVPDSGNAILGA